MNHVPPLHPKPPGLGLRALGLVLPGVRQVSGQIRPYTRWWSDQNQEAVAGDGPLLTVIGDSTAIGIGASSPDNGYVGHLRRALGHRDGTPWRVVNLAQSGARVSDGLERQLPILTDLRQAHRGPGLTVCLIGTNDVVWTSETATVRERLRSLVGRLPDGSLVGLVAGGSPRARAVNRAIRATAAETGLAVVNPWNEPGPPPGERLAADRFHPNDLGYRLMTRPLARQLGAPQPAAATPGDDPRP